MIIVALADENDRLRGTVESRDGQITNLITSAQLERDRLCTKIESIERENYRLRAELDECVKLLNEVMAMDPCRDCDLDATIGYEWPSKRTALLAKLRTP